MALTKNEIQHIARLARLELGEEDLEKYGEQLSGILNYIEMLKEVDASDIEPTSQVTGLENIFRDDVVKGWNKEEKESALRDAPATEGRYIKVRKVFE
jgi:aspartyl-tRNA(Asn)/glutamyl-tRNA(Gln) amidotransferase subunit C